MDGTAPGPLQPSRSGGLLEGCDEVAHREENGLHFATMRHGESGIAEEGTKVAFACGAEVGGEGTDPQGD